MITSCASMGGAKHFSLSLSSSLRLNIVQNTLSIHFTTSNRLSVIPHCRSQDHRYRETVRRGMSRVNRVSS